MKRNSGFTLIEVLIVVTIIGVLSSIVVSSLNTARNKANRVKIDAEFAQLRTAIYQYEVDNNVRMGSFEIGVDGAVSGTQLVGFNEMMGLLIAGGYFPSGIDVGLIQNTLGISSAYPQFLPTSASFYCENSDDRSFTVYFREEDGGDEFNGEYPKLYRAGTPYVTGTQYFYCFFIPIQ